MRRTDAQEGTNVQDREKGMGDENRMDKIKAGKKHGYAGRRRHSDKTFKTVTSTEQTDRDSCTVHSYYHSFRAVFTIGRVNSSQSFCNQQKKVDPELSERKPGRGELCYEDLFF